jgi:hypothetical protein
MNSFPRRHPFSASQPALALLATVVCIVALLAGCKSDPHTSDPKLKPIEKLIDQELPPGTTRDRVAYFLKTRGYDSAPQESGDKLIATINHVDLDTLQPVAARVTFHFDSTDKLVSYDLAPAPIAGP